MEPILSDKNRKTKNESVSSMLDDGAERKKKRLEDIGGRLRHYRENTGMTQEELAARCGVQTNSIYRYENGYTEMGCVIMSNICKALEIPMEYLMDGELPDDETTKLFKQLSPEERESFRSVIEMVLKNKMIKVF